MIQHAKLHFDSRLKISSPHCSLHMIKVLEQYSDTHDYSIGIHARLHHSKTSHVGDCSVQCGIGTRHCEMTVPLVAARKSQS